jgi:hypothetical protein
MMASSSYRYHETLDKTRIRLLNLQAGHDKDDLKIEINISNLSDRLEYEALSYECGTEERLDFVNISRDKINITHGLHTALKRIRPRSRPRRLWVDAICINQDDTSEKNQQVPLMAEIFGRATRVLVWLGPQDVRSDDVFQMLSTLARLWISREVRKQQEGELRPLSWTKVDPTEERVLRSKDKTLWDAVYEISNRSYFRRTWIVQEIALAKDPRVLCGSWEVSWAHFSHATAYLARSLYHLHENPTDAGVARISAITHLRSAYRVGQTIKLAHICTISQNLQSTDERDKVYGFLGLLNTKTKYPALDNLLRVDYGFPVRTVYLQAAQHSIIDDQDLRICHSQAFPSERASEDSSWAPDWSPSTGISQTIVLRPHNKIQGTIEGGISFESEIMQLNGYRVDRISCVSAQMTSENPLPDIQRIMVFLSQDKTAAQLPKNNVLTVDYLEQIISRLGQENYQGLGSQYEALWRTLIANTAFFTSAKPSFKQHFDAVMDSLRLRARGVFWEGIKACDETRMDSCSLFRLLHDTEAQRLYHQIRARDAGPYYRELVNTIGGRVFFATQKGYIGFGSPGTRIGDSVTILNGGWAPFILRQHGEVFQMVGDAYVHGIKTERSWRRNALGQESFRIC